MDGGDNTMMLSDLIKFAQEHIDKYGDKEVFLRVNDPENVDIHYGGFANYGFRRCRKDEDIDRSQNWSFIPHLEEDEICVLEHV